MTKERFTEILIEEGIEPEQIDRLWESKPKNVELGEDNLRLTAQAFRIMRFSPGLH